MKLSLLSTVLALAAAFAPAQMLAPLAPSGQAPLMPIVPLAFGALPPPVVWAAGNPGFAMAALAPAPVPVGLPMVLVLGLAVPPVVIPPPFALPALGPALLTNLGAIVVPAGISGPAPGPMIPLPIPKTGGPIPLLSAHTLVLAGPSIVLTGALGIKV